MLPVSTKRLRPVVATACEKVSCATCEAVLSTADAAKQGWYRDEEPPFEAYCSRHTLLEDLDPNFLGNQNALYGVPTRRSMPFQGVTDLSVLFGDKHVGQKAGEGYKSAFVEYLWVRLPSGSGFPLYCLVKPSPELLQLISATMVYGLGRPLSTHYYLDVCWRDDAALISVKYQRILGQRHLAIVDRQLILDFFLPN